MIVKVKKFAILQTGKLLAVLYGSFAVIMLPFLFIGFLTGGRELWPMIIMIILYPLMGFIGGIIGAFVYNFAARLIGGLEVTLDVEEEPSLNIK